MSHLIAVSLVGIVGVMSVAPANAQGGYLPTGPRGFVAGGPAGPTEYRDVAIGDQPSASLNGGLTLRGFSLSGWAAQDLTTRQDNALELSVSYSQKFPVFDVHAGAAACELFGRLPRCAAGIRLTAETNIFRRRAFGATLDQSWSASDRSWSVFGENVFADSEGLRVTARISGSGWRYSDFGASGVSVGVLIAREIVTRVAVHSYFGVNTSRLETVAIAARKTSPLAAFTIVGTF